MPLRCSLVLNTFVVALVWATTVNRAGAQEILPASAISAKVDLPDAPNPQFYSSADSRDQGAFEPGQESSSFQTVSQQIPKDKTERERAAEQIKEQEHQRVFGIIPAFNTSYRNDAVSLTRKEKMSLAFHSAVDPVTFATAFFVAGINEMNDDDSDFGWGVEGYGKRVGAAYLDTFDGTIIGNGILPSLLHQDPRYFRLGHGSTKRRLLYAAGASFWCRHDNSKRWEPNVSNIGGNIASGAISNLYYPSGDSGVGQTISNGMIVTAEGAIGSVFQEFWPDISRRFFHKDPTRGLDDEARALDKAGKHPEETKEPKK